MDISKIGIGEAPPHDVKVLIEIPQGGVPVKYELDNSGCAACRSLPAHGDVLPRQLPRFIPHTLVAV